MSRKIGPIERFLLLDVFLAQRTRPVVLYTFTMVAIAAALYHWLEGWSWLDAVYFVVVTVTTVGYGDFAPTTSLTKVLTIFVAINGIVILLTLFDAIRRVRGWEITPPEE